MRSLLRNGSVWLILAMLVLVGRSLSGPKQSTVPKCRIALINLEQVLKESAKLASFAKENQKHLEPLQSKAKMIEAKIVSLTTSLAKKDLGKEKRLELETQLTENQHILKEITKETKDLAAQQTKEQEVRLYKDISGVAKRYTKQHDLDLIFHYKDKLVNDPDYFGPANVSRKIEAGALIPLYIRDGLDISNEIISLLNEANYQETKGDDKSKP
jgi:Skp family chaperone for outer membrane proteins